METITINEVPMANPPVCGKCGASLTAGATEGLCPACLIKDGLNLVGAAEQPAERGLQSAPAPEDGGTRIGPYKLLQRLGEGGMGTVWMAEQTEPIRRKVALKIIKPGMDSANVLARFEAERQALALMDHPNIARIIDAGVTGHPLPPDGRGAGGEGIPTLPSGRPYFVMELVKGIPFTKYCDDQRLSIRERLELFLPVCQAIQHAHQKGIIHRDIKPSNVLVAQYDGQPVPKVIDFGVAKAIGQQLTEKTLFTEFGAVIGTLEYMSPEQAEFNQLDIDTRSDIYSLGVLLYQLLTGTTPISRETVQKGALDEMLRCIREQEPPKPSTRLSNLVAADVSRLTSKSETRNPKSEMERASSRRLLQDKEQQTRQVRGDLDWIVMKALEKDRNRRYDTAHGLAMDLQRHLDDEAVLARPPTAAYRLKKFARKHRVAVAAAAGFVLLLTAATAVSTGLAVWANREKARARKSADEARSVLSFFQDKVLAAARPEGEDGGLGYEVTLRSAVDSAASAIANSFTNQARIEISIRDVLGHTYLSLGDHTNGIRQFERALALGKAELGPDDPKTLKLMNSLGWGYRMADRVSESAPLLEVTLKLQKAKLGPDHPDTLWSMYSLACTYNQAGRLSDAVSLFEETLKLRKAKLGPAHPDTLAAMNGLALAYRETGRLSEALFLFEEALGLYRLKPGPDRPGAGTLITMNNLASAYRAAGRLSEAVSLLEDALRLDKAKLGPDHPNTLRAMDSLANAYRDAGRLSEAMPLRKEALELKKAKLGLDHVETLVSMNNLAAAYHDGNRLSEAVSLMEETLKLQKAKYGPDHPNTLRYMGNLAGIYENAGRLSEALPLTRETLMRRITKLGPDHPDSLASMNGLVRQCQKAGPLSEAWLWLDEALELGKAKLGPDHRATLGYMDKLVVLYHNCGASSQALALAEKTLSLRRFTLGPDDAETLLSMKHLAIPYILRTNRFAEAEALLREYLVILEKKYAGHTPTDDAQSLLGLALVRQKKYSEAELVLAQAYEEVTRRYADNPEPYAGSIVSATAERFVELYEAWGKPEQAAKWPANLLAWREAGIKLMRAKLGAIPPRNPNARAELIDLSKYYSGPLTNDWQMTTKGNDLAKLPTGIQNIDAIEFDVRGVIQLLGQGLANRLPGTAERIFPSEVKAIVINRKCHRLHLFHGTGWGSSNGTEIAKLTLHYQDGGQLEIPIVYGTDVRGWWVAPGHEAEKTEHASIAWTGSNKATEGAGQRLRLYRRTWENPRPNEQIETIDYVSTMTEAAPFLIALTVE